MDAAVFVAAMEEVPQMKTTVFVAAIEASMLAEGHVMSPQRGRERGRAKAERGREFGKFVSRWSCRFLGVAKM